uniref:Zinc finger and BTB domain containing 34 n=1 Tax=Cynoglossus semilaevis TaxID=244447 RepID=A0A3P8WQA8_CYNSE
MDDGSYIEFDVPEFSNTGQPFRAHKAVLAASSPYFRDHSALSTMSGLSISVIKSPEVFEQLLAFCYTGHMSLQLKDIISFLTAASFLQMQSIIDKCTQVLERLHSKISLPVGTPEKDELPTSRNGDNDSNLFVNPTQISPPYFSRQNQGGHGAGRGRQQQQQEEGQSDRGSSDGVSEHDNPMEGETEQVELIGKDGQVTDVHVKVEKPDRPSYSDSSSAGDDGYHTELVDGEQVLAVSVGSYCPVIQPATYSYSGLTSPCFVNINSSSPSRSMLSGYRGGRARSKRPVVIPAGMLSHLKPDDKESPAGAPGLENDVRERSLRSQWYPYNERLICIYCGKTFNQKGSLDRHMRLHMGITPFVCKFCGKKYTRKDQLEYHIRGHTDNKPFHCQICGKCFPFQGTLNQHLRKKHMGASESNIQVDSPERTEGSAGRKDQEEASEGMKGPRPCSVHTTSHNPTVNLRTLLFCTTMK